MTFRRVLLWSHRWAGLIVAPIAFILALTGGLMIWEHELDALLNPSFFRVTPAEPLPLDELVAKTRVRHPREGRAIAGVLLPQHAGDPLRMLVGGGRVLFIDPATGDELGTRATREGLVYVITRTHLSLFMGRTGAWIVGLVTAVTLFMAIGGLWLWWPLRIVWFRANARWPRFNFELHSLAGLYSSIFLLIVALTGVTMSFHAAFDPWIRAATGDTAPPRPPQVAPRAAAERVSFGRVVEAAERALPGARVVSFGAPFQPTATYRVQLRFPEDRTPGGRSLVYIDPYTAEPLQVFGTRGQGAGNWYIHFSHSLHNGELFGLPTQVLALFVCLALVAQIVSGFVMWWKPWRGATASAAAA